MELTEEGEGRRGGKGRLKRSGDGGRSLREIEEVNSGGRWRAKGGGVHALVLHELQFRILMVFQILQIQMLVHFFVGLISDIFSL